MSKSKLPLPGAYNVEERIPATPLGNPWVVFRDGERIGSAPTERQAVGLVEHDVKARARHEKLLASCRALLAAGKRVEAIKQYRTETGASLAIAREVLERGRGCQNASR